MSVRERIGLVSFITVCLLAMWGVNAADEPAAAEAKP